MLGVKEKIKTKTEDTPEIRMFFGIDTTKRINGNLNTFEMRQWHS